MSQVNTKTVLLGSNADQSKNFKITVPTPEDGTLTIERANGTDVMVVADDGKVTFPESSGSETKPSTSGTAINFTVPAGCKQIRVLFNSVSTNGTNNLSIRIGDGSVESSGYSSVWWNIVTGGAPTNASAVQSAGFNFGNSNAASVLHGFLDIIRRDPSASAWFGNGVLHNGQSGANLYSSGVKSLASGDVTTVQITTMNQVDTFDAGSITVQWEK